jgi:transcriptional regulator with XRE-family HTH domain
MHRRQRCLNQEELAFLLGKKNASFVCRFELRKRDPGLEAAFACQVLFDVSPSELFPGLFAEIEEAVMRRAYRLDERLKLNPSAATQAKRTLLKAVLSRAARRIDKTEA